MRKDALATKLDLSEIREYAVHGVSSVNITRAHKGRFFPLFDPKSKQSLETRGARSSQHPLAASPRAEKRKDAPRRRLLPRVIISHELALLSLGGEKKVKARECGVANRAAITSMGDFVDERMTETSVAEIMSNGNGDCA